MIDRILNASITFAVTLLLLSCANNRSASFLSEPNFGAMEWKRMEIYYVVNSEGSEKLLKSVILDKQEISKGFSFLDKSKTSSYPYPLICPNKSTTADGLIWKFDFVFEDRIDFVLRSHTRYGYSVFPRDYAFYNWVVDQCWNHSLSQNPTTARNQIQVRISEFMNVPGVREIYVPE